MRPTLRFLDEKLISKIIDESQDVLSKVGVEINNPKILDLLYSHKVKIDKKKNRAYISNEVVTKALESAPASIELFDVLGRKTLELKEKNVYFTPGSAAINILDHKSKQIRPPTSKDYVDFCKIMSKLDNIASISTAFIPADVHQQISDSYRLYLSLLYSEKPVVTGAFTIEAFEIMKDLLLMVRGSKENLALKPLSIFSCCPTAPLKWSDVTSQNLLDCAQYSIPVEFISMPLSGFVAPVTLVGSLVQHTAETLSGIVISQLAHPGAPIIYGGSPAIFDVRYETTPMGAIETQMIDCAYNEIGKFLNLPTQAYIALSDSKQFDAQAGSETAMGATLAALSGINQISGPGMLDFESCQSLEKLVMDNELCGMVLRMIKGIEPKEDFPAAPLFHELLDEKHLLISMHTRKYLKEEHYFPGPLINRANSSRWKEEGELTIEKRASLEIDKLINEYKPSELCETIKKELTSRMTVAASHLGMEKLPHTYL